MRGIVRHSIEHINKYGNNPACAGKGFAGEAAFDGAGNNPACAGKRLHEQQVYGATMEFSSTLSSTLAYYTPRTQLLNCYSPPFYPRFRTKLHIKGFVQCFIEILPVRAKESVYTEVGKQ